MAGHPGSQRMTDDETSLVSDLVAAGVLARQELTILRYEFLSSLATARTLYNNKAANRLQQLPGRFPIQALIDELEANFWTFEFKTDVIGRITHLFLAHPAMSVLLVDTVAFFCQIARMKQTDSKCHSLTSSDELEQISLPTRLLYFLSGKEKADYQWALQQMKEKLDVIPRVLLV